MTETVETLQEAVLQSPAQTLGAGQLTLLQLGNVQVCNVLEQGHGGQGVWNTEYHWPQEGLEAFLH